MDYYPGDTYVDWTGVDARHKEAILVQEVNFAAITPERYGSE